jgi:hypothetical protein
MCDQFRASEPAWKEVLLSIGQMVVWIPELV